MFSAGTIQTRNPADAGLLGQVDVKCPSLKDGHLARPSHVLRQVHLDAHLNRVRQDILGTIRKSNKALKDSYFILTKFDNRSTLTRQMQQTITVKANALNIKFLGCVRTAIAVKEAAALQKSIYEYAPKSKPAQDYLEILEQLI